MAKWAKALAVKPEDLSPIPLIRMMEGEDQRPQVIL